MGQAKAQAGVGQEYLGGGLCAYFPTGCSPVLSLPPGPRIRPVDYRRFFRAQLGRPGEGGFPCSSGRGIPVSPMLLYALPLLAQGGRGPAAADKGTCTEEGWEGGRPPDRLSHTHSLSVQPLPPSLTCALAPISSFCCSREKGQTDSGRGCQWSLWVRGGGLQALNLH